MRTIKFRRPYFDRKTDKFSHFGYWGVKTIAVFVPICSDEHYSKEDQQFTGLFDAKGKEIYEGDIIEASYFTGKYIGIVKYEIQASKFQIKWERKAIQYNSNLNVTYGDDTGYYCEHMDVIGNIFETPELINQMNLNNKT